MIVSDLALIKRFPISISFAHPGTSPQRRNSIFLVSALSMEAIGCVSGQYYSEVAIPIVTLVIPIPVVVLWIYMKE
jgi:hypothetical protein